jgi:hypothetical protein
MPDRQQLIGALVTLATVLFLMAIAPGFRYRRAARIAAVSVYSAVLAGVVVWVVLWWLGVSF